MTPDYCVRCSGLKDSVKICHQLGMSGIPTVFNDSPREKSRQRRNQSLFWIASPAFPDDQSSPAVFSKLLNVSSVSVDVALPLYSPKFRIGRGDDSTISALMTVPETPVDENHLSRCAKNQVRRSRQSPIMQAKSVSHGVNNGSHNHLGSRVFGTNP